MSRPGEVTNAGTREQAVVGVVAEMVRKLTALDRGPIRARSQMSKDLEGILVEADDNAAAVIRRAATRLGFSFHKCLDYGCGSGPHRADIESVGFEWVGCDYADSRDPATLARSGKELDGQVVKYDGVTLPFESSSFSMVWSWQSLEHVQSPERALAEIARCLVPGGVLAGSVSFLEPYHAQSTYGYTPYGFRLICERHGLRLVECVPAMDALSFFIKRLALMLGVSEDGNELHRKLAAADILGPVRDLLQQNGLRQQYPDLLAQVCGAFRFIAVK